MCDDSACDTTKYEPLDCAPPMRPDDYEVRIAIVRIIDYRIGNRKHVENRLGSCLYALFFRHGPVVRLAALTKIPVVEKSVNRLGGSFARLDGLDDRGRAGHRLAGGEEILRLGLKGQRIGGKVAPGAFGLFEFLVHDVSLR